MTADPQPNLTDLTERAALVSDQAKRLGRETRILVKQAAQLRDALDSAAANQRQSEEDTRDERREHSDST